MIDCDYLIIGCGITGLSIARELVNRGERNIIVTEKESRTGVHASGRNSGVLHSGIYYLPGSLKAKFCAEGNERLTDYCVNRGLSINRCGKVIVAKNEQELDNLKLLEERGVANDVEYELLDEEQLKRREPYAYTYKNALFSPNTAVFDPVEILGSLKSELESTGRVTFMFNTAFISGNEGFSARTTGGDIRFGKMINCAGAFADRIAHNYGTGYDYRILPFLGTYRKLKEPYSYLVRGNIYPVPDLRNPFLGVHFTRAIDGTVYIGPTAIPAPGRESYELFKGITRETASIVYRDIVLFFKDSAFRDNAMNEIKKYLSRYVFTEARKMLPSLDISYMERSSKVGIRPQLVDWKNKRLADDFVVLKDRDGNVHVLNAISPAFTSSMAFASHVVDTFV